MSPDKPPRIRFRLYAITDGRQVRAGTLPELLELLAAAGLRGIQLREKSLPETGLRTLAGECRPALERYGVQWLVNGSIAVALGEHASGVHLASAQDVSGARSTLGASALVGKSVHSRAEACHASAAGADFLLFGPVFDTPSKREFGPPQGIERLREVCESVVVPVFAVGGVTAERVPECMDAGASGVAVVSALMGAENPVEVLKEYGRKLGRL